MALLDKISHVLNADLTKEFKFNKKQFKEDLSLLERLQRRQPVSMLGKKVHYSQSYLAEVIQLAIASCPLVYNTQTTCAVILFGQSHQEFWQLVQQVQRQEMPAHIFSSAVSKIQQCELAFGTVLFYQDQAVIKNLQKNVPLMAQYFPTWSEQANGMAQFATWMALADSGLGATLQHYQPSIEQCVAQHFQLNKEWKLTAQLVFGSIDAVSEQSESSANASQCKIFY